MEGSVGVAYGDDPVRAIEAIRNLLAADVDVTAEPAPALAEEGLTIPYPQRDMHVKQATALT